MTVQEIVEKCGGTDAVSLRCLIGERGIAQWNGKGIPRKYYVALQDMAGALGNKLPVHDLVTAGLDNPAKDVNK